MIELLFLLWSNQNYTAGIATLSSILFIIMEGRRTYSILGLVVKVLR